jgi:hypothetical protein
MHEMAIANTINPPKKKLLRDQIDGSVTTIENTLKAKKALI